VPAAGDDFGATLRTIESHYGLRLRT
jgi:hypothetical protein